MEYNYENKPLIVKVIRKDGTTQESLIYRDYKKARYAFDKFTHDRNNGIVQMLDLDTRKSILMFVDYEGLITDIILSKNLNG